MCLRKSGRRAPKRKAQHLCAGSAREGCPRGRRNQRQGYMGLDENHDLTGWQMEDSEHGSACGGEADHLPKRDSRSRKCTPQICSERVVIANKKIAMSPFSAAPQGTKSVPRTASERNGGTRLQHVWNSEGKTCTSFWSLWGRYGSHSGLIFGSSGANLGALRPKWLASGVLGALGVLWGSSGDHLGAVLNPSWVPIGAILGRLGAVRGRLGAILGPS